MSYASQDTGRHALLVGICSYPNFGPGAQLKGCVADVRAMARALRHRFGFPAENVLRLEDEEATRERILGALGTLCSRVRRGDVVVVHYSGHGSRVRSPERPSGWTETLVPSDSGRAPLPNRDILDSELRAWLLEISNITPYLTFVFDSCFSGGIVRRTARARWVAPDPRPLTRPLARPPMSPPGAQAMRDVGPSGWLPLGDRYVLFAGCRADEESFELCVDEGRSSHHGALTYHLCRELEAASVTASNRDVFEPVAARVTASFFRQHPQLEGARHRRFLGLEGIPSGLETLDPGHGNELPRLALERAARFRHLLTLDNRDPDSRLRGRLEVELRRRRPGKSWETAESRAPGAEAAVGPSFDEGDQVALVITNHHSETVYITILDFGLSGRISVLFPVAGAQQSVLPGRTLRVGEDPLDPWVLSAPDGFPFEGRHAGAPVEGVEHFKVLATLHEADFQSLVQEGYAIDPLQHESADQAGDWTGVTRSFVLRRKK